MATIYVDDRPYVVKDGQNLLHACLSVGLEIPYFCWHPALHSVGACRQCAVKLFKDAGDAHGRIVMSCMTPAADNVRISIDDPEAHAFRAAMIELLMSNHPHDCPVCDEGGECHLQDMTVMAGHTYRRFRGRKRTHRNQNLGPFVNHEMNRCIACYRCVRFYGDYAGGRDLNVFASHNYVYFGRHADGALESPFAGNLVEVCPTGVFTDKTLKRHYTRKWDLQTAPSVCAHCGVGCNTFPGERYGTLRRVHNRFNDEVNGYFLCDRGRFGYEFVNSERRLRTARPNQALALAGKLLQEGGRAIGIGSPRASLESNYALRALVGPERFFQGVSERERSLSALALDIMRRGSAPIASVRDIGEADAALVLGEDPTHIAPLVALALRQVPWKKQLKIAARLRIPYWDMYSVRGASKRESMPRLQAPLYLATTLGGPLDEVAGDVFHGAPADAARLGFAVAHALASEAPATDMPDETAKLAARIAAALAQAERPVIVAGGDEHAVRAAANVAAALFALGKPASLALTQPECNTLGLGLIGGVGLEGALETIKSGAADTLIVLENDLYRHADASLLDSLLSAAAHVIVLDHLENATVAKAEIVFPAATFAEATGTLVNYEARAQRFFKVFQPEGEIQESWRWLRELGVAAGRSEFTAWRNVDDVLQAMARELPIFAPAVEAAPPADFRLVGQKMPRQQHRYTGRTAVHAHEDVNEPVPPADPDSPLAFSMEGHAGAPPNPLPADYWAPKWNSVQALTAFQTEVNGPLRTAIPGKRLIEGAAGTKSASFFDAPPAFAPRPGEWLVTPIRHVFGSDELSAQSASVASLVPRPYVALNPDDARDLGLAPEQSAAVTIGDQDAVLPVALNASLPRGVVGLFAAETFSLPAWVKIRIARPQEETR